MGDGYVVKLCSPTARGRLGPQGVTSGVGGMLSNFAPQRREAGWGRRGGMSGAEDPTGFRPVVKEFENIEPVGAAVGSAL